MKKQKEKKMKKKKKNKKNLDLSSVINGFSNRNVSRQKSIFHEADE